MVQLSNNYSTTHYLNSWVLSGILWMPKPDVFTALQQQNKSTISPKMYNDNYTDSRVSITESVPTKTDADITANNIATNNVTANTTNNNLTLTHKRSMPTDTAVTNRILNAKVSTILHDSTPKPPTANTINTLDKITNNLPLINHWQTLVKTINACTLCDLCQSRTNVVIERGSRDASWMFIGEGPGETEDLQAKPFVGLSGKLLDKMIVAMQLDSSQVYITNIIKCRPPQNRNPSPTEITACNNYLMSQIALVKPVIIITLGRFAAQTLLNTETAIGKLRGQVHQYQTSTATIPLIVSYHPAYLLRMPSAKAAAWQDLQLALSAFSRL